MYKRGLTREQANEIAVTNRVTIPSPAVTGPIVIPAGPKLRHAYTLEDHDKCDLMHWGVVKSLSVEDRIGSRVGHRSIRAFSIEATTVTPAHRDDDPREVRRMVRAVEVDLANMVWDTVFAMFARDPYAVRLVVAIACGAKWPRLLHTDAKRRGTKMLGYVRLNALYRMWLASGERLMPLMLQVEPQLIELLAAQRKKSARD